MWGWSLPIQRPQGGLSLFDPQISMGYRLNSSGHFLPFLFLTRGAFFAIRGRKLFTTQISGVPFTAEQKVVEKTELVVDIYSQVGLQLSREWAGPTLSFYR